MDIKPADWPPIFRHAFRLVACGEPLRGGRRIGKLVMAAVADPLTRPTVRENVLGVLKDPVVGPEAVVVVQQLLQNEFGYPADKMGELFTCWGKKANLHPLQIAAALYGKTLQWQFINEPNPYRGQRIAGSLAKMPDFLIEQKGVALRISLVDRTQPREIGTALSEVSMGLQLDICDRGNMLHFATLGVANPYYRGVILAGALLDIGPASEFVKALNLATADLRGEHFQPAPLALLLRGATSYRKEQSRPIIDRSFPGATEAYVDIVCADKESVSIAEQWQQRFVKQCQATRERMADLFKWLN